MVVSITFNWTPTSRAANSYTGLARADVYFDQRPNSGNWTGGSVTDDQKAQALVTATRAIDQYPGIPRLPFINYNSDQILKFPQQNVAVFYGTVDSATTTTAIDSALANDQFRPNDYWNWGAIRITSGTGADQVREITDFATATGTVTIEQVSAATWATTPDATSNYEIVARIPDEIFYACCEIAYLYMPDATTGIVDDGAVRARLQAQGVKSFSIANHSETYNMINGYMIPIIAIQWLEKYVVRAY